MLHSLQEGLLHQDDQGSALCLPQGALHPDTLRAYVATPALFDHDFSTASAVYIPLDGEERADRELGGLIESARAALRPYLVGQP